MFNSAVNTLLRARLVYNKQRQVYKIIAAFNLREQSENGRYRFPQQRKCDYVSGDIVYATLAQDVQRVEQDMRARLRTDRIEWVK
jgi:hypothetical protein